MILLITVLATIFLLLWYYLAMFFLRRMTPLRDWGVLVFRGIEFLVLLGIGTDVLYNLTFGTLVFMEFPVLLKGSGTLRKRLGKGEWTLTQRLTRIRFESRGWRLALADFVCEKLLNPKSIEKQENRKGGKHC